MKMSLLVLGLLVLMLSILMNEACAVVPHQGTLVRHHLIGAVVASANRWREWRRFTSAVERGMEQSGILVFETTFNWLYYVCAMCNHVNG
ncbi:unnamed protein product [Ilex paraguariensis]|uniref:Uncharacterized protein n=1 Tax=Ilex paraguariensis TaxID=185542 RepID=A0ABC8TDH1_9AQUA